MKTSNVEPHGLHAAAATRGQRSALLAGAKGMIWRDGSTESVGQIRDMTVVGLTFTDYGDGTGILSAGGTSGTGTPPWVNVVDYGTVGDGTTDDTAAINLAIDAINLAGCGVLYFPCGTYRITGSLTEITASCTILGDGAHNAYDDGVSIIACDSTTATVFTVSGYSVRFDKLAIKNVSASTVTAGAAILAKPGDGFRRTMYSDLYISWFYDGIDSQGGTHWTARDVVIFDAWRYGFRIRNTADPDAGDWLLDHVSVLNNGLHDTTAGLRIESSGAGRVQNYESLGAIGSINYPIDIVGDGTTSVLHVIGASLESYGNDGIRSAGSWNFQTFTNIEFGQYVNGSGKAFNLSGNSDVVIDNINLRADTGTPTAIALSSMSRVAIGQITNNGFGTIVSPAPDQDSTGGVGARVFITGTPSSGQVPIASSGTAAAWGSLSSGGIAPNTADYLVGTANAGLTSEIVVGTSPGGELGGSWASPTVDTIHSGSAHLALGTTSTTAAAGDHTHASSGGHILLADGRSTPFTFNDLLQADDGSDFLWTD